LLFARCQMATIALCHQRNSKPTIPKHGMVRH
jgi:hypothetical protein